MSKLKKFSDILSGQMLSESVDSTKVQSAVEVLMNKMGYDNIEELKREKSLISKLETLLKEFSPKTDISEDEAEDIEDEVVKRGTPKKLVELDEDEAEEIEDEVVKRGTPKKLMEDEAEEIEYDKVKMGIPKDKSVEIEAEMDKMIDVKGKEIKSNSSKRILSFDEFVSESYDYTVSEGNAFFAARAKAIQEERDEFEFNGKTYKLTTSSKSINEAEIKSDDEFKEYVTTVLKKAFGKDFDQAKADEVADGLIKKHKGDYGAMVGALQSSMG
jgi:hypothetical protein